MSHVLELPASTIEYVQVPVVLDRGVTDPTTFGVELALAGALLTSPPDEDDWIEAVWVSGGPPYLARLLVSEPTPGLYGLWVRVDANPEKPVRLAGKVRFV